MAERGIIGSMGADPEDAGPGQNAAADHRAIRGRLLVASPLLPDGAFRRTVVWVVEHTEDGTVGIVLNRPDSARIADTIPRWAALAPPPAVFFVGGPVEPAALLGLAELAGEGPPRPKSASAPPLAAGGAIGLIDLATTDDVLARRVRRVRAFQGYAAWAGGQLAGELEVGAWFMADPRPADLFGSAPATLWHDVLQRQRSALSSLAAYPADTRLN